MKNIILILISLLLLTGCSRTPCKYRPHGCGVIETVGRKIFEDPYAKYMPRKPPLEVHHYHYGIGKEEFSDDHKDEYSGRILTYLHPNGGKKSEGIWKDGKQEGTWTGWYENGQKGFERNFRNGEEEGLWTEWYETGQKNWEGNYKNGKLEGLWTEWFENGEKKHELHLKDGKKEGLFTTYDEEGSVIKTEEYKDGKLVK